MSLLIIDNLSLQFGGKTIFEEASLSIEASDRLGIIGANGTGKSTLMKILVGRAQPDGGRVMQAKGIRLGYLEQEHSAPGSGALLDTVLSTAPGKTAIETRLKAAEEALAEAKDPEEQLALAEELGDLHAVLSDLDTRFAKHEAERILAGLGFENSEFTRPVSELSGGWRMRAALAALLYQHPDVLLLDEPTNHLDMPSVHWLSGYLKAFKQALVLISHDREFLNSQVKRIASLEVEGLRQYRGNYDLYLEQREQELELLENSARRSEARKKELESFVERFKAKATKARQAQSRVKMIEKLEAQEVDIPKPRRAMTISFKPTARSSDTVLTVEKLRYGYSETPLFSDLSLYVRRGDRIAIVGKNGAGKTTLLKLLAAELTPDDGAIKLGSGVSPSYFAQHHAEVLDARKNVLEEVWNAAPGLSQTEARAICGAFLFSGDDVEKAVGVLSGGEKARVALARMLAAPGNMLLLDEPTNHLDTESASKLTESLQSYDGTLLFVSHNLDFARRLSNKVWDVHDGIVETYPGSLADYLEHLELVEREREGTLPDGPAPVAAGAQKGAVVVEDKVLRKEAWKEKREREAEERKKRSAVKRRVTEVEAKIAALETEQAELETALADPATHLDAAKSKQSAHRYAEVKRTLEVEMTRWEQLTIELEALGPEA